MIDSGRNYNISKTHDEEILDELKRGIVSEHRIDPFVRFIITRRLWDRDMDIDFIEKLMLAKEEGLTRRKLGTESYVSKFELSLWPPYLKIERQRYLDDDVDI